MTDSALSPQQLAVICALSSGATITAAAEEAGVHRNTINNWRRNSLPFQQALADAQYDRALYFREKAEALFDLAIHAIDEILADPKTAPSVRLKAALAVITTATTAPKSQQPPPANLHNFAQSTPDILVSSDSFAADSQPLHKPAQPPAAHKIGRNEPCPCGSGKKYKRCCLGGSPVQSELTNRMSGVSLRGQPSGCPAGEAGHTDSHF